MCPCALNFGTLTCRIGSRSEMRMRSVFGNTRSTVTEASDGTNDDSELSADAEDGDEDSDVSPTMVASDEHDDEQRPIGEPPRED